MENAFVWGLIATSSLMLGGIIALMARPSNRVLGIIMGFGAGTLISAVAYELMFEAVKLAKGSGFPAFGFFGGALVFFFSDKFLESAGAKDRKAINPSQQASLLFPMVLAIILDGVPESLVIGLGILENGTVSVAMLVAVFISNLPESIAGTTGMKASQWGWKKIIILWLSIALTCAVATVAGYGLLENASPKWLAFINAFAGGAILMMLSNTMIPEAFEHGGKLAGVSTVMGFAVSVSIVLLERA
jgi:zinc transporter, ZIP family